MLIEPMIEQLHTLNLHGMAAALTHLLSTPQQHALTFEERLSLLIEREQTDRHSKRLSQRLRWAKLPQSATFEDLDTRTPRGIDQKLIAQLATLKFIVSARSRTGCKRFLDLSQETELASAKPSHSVSCQPLIIPLS